MEGFEINAGNIYSVIAAINTNYLCTRFKVSVSDHRPESLFPFIFDGKLLGEYRCYITEIEAINIKDATVSLILYLTDIPNEKLVITSHIPAFGTASFERKVAEVLEASLND